MRTLTETEVTYLNHIRDIIRERGADFVYDPADEFDDEDILTCVYIDQRVPVGQPVTGSCLIGKLLIDKLHIDPTLIEEGVGFGLGMAEAVLDRKDYRGLSAEFIAALGTAQSDQDSGMVYASVWEQLVNRLAFRGYAINSEEWEL